MRLLTLLLFMTATFILCASWEEIKFCAKALHNDLEAIENYYVNIGTTLTAYIYWPNNIAFQVNTVMIDSKDYVKVQGKFDIKTKEVSKMDDDSLYFRRGSFYVKDKKSKEMIYIQLDTEVYYIEPAELSGEDSYLSIRYHSFEDVMESAQLLYSEHSDYLNEINPKPLPGVYLSILDEHVPHFLEYTTFGRGGTTEADKGLFSLIGEITNNKVQVHGIRRNYRDRLVFHEQAQNLTLTAASSDLTSNYAKSVFGLRMASVGFLAEVHYGRVKMLGNSDLWFQRSPFEHTVDVDRLMSKIKNVEPASVPPKGYDLRVFRGPHDVQFQVEGHILVKKLNFNQHEDGTKTIKEECPLVIELEKKESVFYFESTKNTVSRMCTDNLRLWLETDPTFLKDTETVTIFYEN